MKPSYFVGLLEDRDFPQHVNQTQRVTCRYRLQLMFPDEQPNVNPGKH